MKIKEYIRQCNDIELAEFLSSIYWTSLQFDITIRYYTIEEESKELFNLLQQEIPQVIPFVNKKLIDTSTGKVLE